MRCGMLGLSPRILRDPNPTSRQQRDAAMQKRGNRSRSQGPTVGQAAGPQKEQPPESAPA